jgi:hypothetical protein
MIAHRANFTSVFDTIIESEFPTQICVWKKANPPTLALPSLLEMSIQYKEDNKLQTALYKLKPFALCRSIVQL